jgi:REP element-mobilizing transposase RayT
MSGYVRPTGTSQWAEPQCRTYGTSQSSQPYRDKPAERHAMPQSHAQVWLHVVFSTKERREFLRTESFRDQMFRMLAHQVKECGCVSASVGGHLDHVHLLVGLSRTLTIANLVEHVKIESSKWAKTVHPRHALFHWQSGYAAFSVSHSLIDKVDAYIRSQEQHHATKSFQDEYRELCKKHGIAVDERFVWD